MNISEILRSFISIIAENYDLSQEHVRVACCNKKVVVSPSTKQKSILFEQAKEYVSLDTPSGKMTVDKLKEMCKTKGLKVTGKKSELIERLENPTLTENKAGNTTRKKKSLFKPRDVTKIIAKLQGNISKLSVKKNSEGKYVHEETNIVFDPVTQKAIGKYKDGILTWLTKADIELCISYGVLYELPENLDYGVVKVVDKKVEEVLGEDDFKDESEEEQEDDDAED